MHGLERETMSARESERERERERKKATRRKTCMGGGSRARQTVINGGKQRVNMTCLLSAMLERLARSWFLSFGVKGVQLTIERILVPLWPLCSRFWIVSRLIIEFDDSLELLASHFNTVFF